MSESTFLSAPPYLSHLFSCLLRPPCPSPSLVSAPLLTYTSIMNEQKSCPAGAPLLSSPLHCSAAVPHPIQNCSSPRPTSLHAFSCHLRPYHASPPSPLDLPAGSARSPASSSASLLCWTPPTRPRMRISLAAYRRWCRGCRRSCASERGGGAREGGLLFCATWHSQRRCG